MSPKALPIRVVDDAGEHLGSERARATKGGENGRGWSHQVTLQAARTQPRSPTTQHGGPDG